MAKYLKQRAPKLLPFRTPLDLTQRKQIYLPDFTVTLIRTPFLPPNYASFWVPLNFNKLDIKDYLKRAYNVDVLKVRSYVEQQNVTREMPRGRQGYGALRRPMSKKRMTVEMTEPFVWPEPPTDHEAWEKDRFYETKKMQDEYQDSHHPDATKKAPKTRREILAEQAQKILDGKETWKPTWQALGLNYNRPVVNPMEQSTQSKSLELSPEPSPKE